MKKLLAMLCAMAMLLSMTATVAAADTVIAIYNGKEYTSFEAILQEYNYGLIQLQTDLQDLTISRLVEIDLNGHNIHNVNVAKNTLFLVDTQTDDCSVADGVYGQLTGTITGDIQPEFGYMMVQQESGISFHRVEMEIYEMTLRPSVAGVYYRSYFRADEIAAQRVERYGVALSVETVPTADTIETQCICSYFEDFQAGEGNIATTTLLKNIMKPTNSDEVNWSNSRTIVYGRPYVKTADGYVFGGGASRNLQEQVEAADAQWDTLDAEQQAALTAMYETYANAMEYWEIPNAKGEEPEQPGGGDQPDVPEQPDQPDQPGGGSGSDDGDITITIGLSDSAWVLDYYDNAFTQWLEEQTGYDLEFVHYSSGVTDAKNQINTQIAMGEELPDILWGINLGDSSVSQFGQEGYLQDLSAYFADRTGASKTFWDRLNNEVSATVRADVVGRMKDPNNGAIYAVPSVTTEPSGDMKYQVWINQEWLDALGLGIPTNISELYEVLVAFRDRDPNGNGRKDEIPLLGSQRATGAYVIDWLINQFVYYDSSTSLNVDENGKIYAPFTTDSYRQALIFIHKLFSDGLLSQMSFSIGSAEMKFMFAPSYGAMCGVVVANPLIHTDYGSETLREYTALPNWGYSVYNTNVKMDTYITADCENPDAAFKLLMLMWSKEGSLRMRFGEYGVDWTDADPGTTSGYGLTAELKLLNEVTNQMDTSCWHKCASTLNANASGEAAQLTGNETSWEAYRMEMIGDAWENYNKAAQWNNPSNLCPTLVYTEDESYDYASQISQCKSYVEQMKNQFITATDPSNDASWNEYLEALEANGLQDWLEVAQAAYDRQK